MEKTLILLIVSCLLSGCVSSTRMNRISTGMSKTQVYYTVGTPDSKTSVNNNELLRYKSFTGADAMWCFLGIIFIIPAYAMCSGGQDNYIILSNGQVTEIGEGIRFIN